MQGYLIDIASQKKKHKLKDIRSLMRNLDRPYHIHSTTHSPDFLVQMNSKLVAPNTILSEETEKSFRWSKAQFLLYSNLFFRKLHQSIQPPHMYKLRNATGQGITPKVLQIFSEFNKSLLSPPSAQLCPASLAWLDSLLLPHLSALQIRALNAPCSPD